ncbi:MAG: amidohydrolase family protein [Ferruginibacter sp.]
MQRIDAHQHFWQFDPVRDSWISEEMAVIQKDFLPKDIQPVLQENNIDGCVTVQSDQSEKENEFQLNNAAAFDFIKGVVGWVDLQAKAVEERLAYYCSFKKMKGFRHILQGEADRALMLKPAFMNGMAKLKQFGFTYDVLIFPDQLKYVGGLVAAFPDQKFVIDHIAKPGIKEHKTGDWEKDIRSLGGFENLYCKISGMVTEADWKNWERDNFTPYMDTVVDAFGTSRIMFGSDWPVCLVAASYKQMLEIVTDYFSSFTVNEKENFFGLNAVQFYNL